MRRYMLALTTLALAGCPDDGKGETDTTDTTDTSTDTSDIESDTSPDTSDVEPDSTDTTDTTDTTPGRTVAGTSLEGVTIVWDTPMTLCSDWTEGASLEDEKARKVIIEIPAQPRTTLDEDALAVRLQGLDLRTSPFATGHHRPDAQAEQTRVTTWQILAGGGSSHTLSATVEHTLSGKAGTLYVNYAVGRMPNSPDPVEVSPETWEVSFAWQPWGSALQPTRLTRCGGAPDLEDAVSVATGYDGKEWVTLVRFWRTQTAFAGSYPSHLVGHRIVTSDQPWWPTEVRGFWAHTYVAEHHNWNDATEVDLAGDIGHWHHTLPNRPEETVAISKVSVEGVLGFDDAAIVVERLSDDGPAVTRYAMEDARDFVRVDAAHLIRQNITRCDGEPPHVIAAGAADHVAQVIFCGDARPTAVALVPVIWASNPRLIGTEVAVRTSEANAWSFDVGNRDVTVFLRPDDNIELLILDAEGELVSQSYEPRGALQMRKLWTNPVQVTSEVAGVPVSFEIGRQWVTFGIGKSQIWAPTHFTVTYGDQTWRIESWDRMDYTNTHHNWEDELIAEADDGTTIRWKTSFMNAKPNLLTITSADGLPILPETLLP